MLSTLYSTSAPSTDNFDPATLRRASAHRHSLAPLPSMDDFRFGAQPADSRLSQEALHQLAMSSRSSSRHRSHRSASSSNRRSSLPLLATTQTGIIHATHPHPYLPSPRSSTFRHRPSVSSVTTNGTSASASTSTNDEVMAVQPPDTSSELSGIYRDMQSYVFGASSSSQHSPSASASASANPNPFAPGPSSLRNVRGTSRHSSSATSMGIAVGTAMRRNSLYDDTDMNDLSDAASAYSPEDDGGFGGSQRQNSFAAAMDRMEIDQERKFSRDMSLPVENASSRASVRSLEKKRDRGNRHSRGPGFSSAVLAMTRYDADRSDELSTDEDDSNRTMERSKMRAIDDGSRRPSLPTNVHHGPDAPSHSLAQASTAPVPASPTNFRFGEDAGPRMSIPASPTTPTAATFAAMMMASASGSNAAMSATSLRPLQPLKLPTAPAMNRGGSSPTKSAAPSSPFSPTSFYTAATSPSESHDSQSSHDIKGRPRSRSNRALKPLPSFMANAGIDSSWVPPWSASSSSDGTAVAKTDSSMSNNDFAVSAASRLPSPPPGILPPGTNPFLMSSSAQARGNPFARRDRSATVTQQSVSGSAFPPPLQLAKSASANGTKRDPASPLTTPPAATAANGNNVSIVNTSPSPPPEESSTDPTADFDLAFILSGAEVATNNGLSPSPPDAGNYAARKASLAPSIEDSFIRFVNKFDDEYGERRDRWSYRLERPSFDHDHQGDYWRCENMGRYWVGREAVDDGIASTLDGSTADNSISVRYCPTEGDRGYGKQNSHSRSRSYGSSGDEMSPPRGGPVPPGPMSPTLTPSQRRSNVRVQVKKHYRAPAFTLYLGPRAPRAISASRPSVLLAPKAYHLHTSAPKGKQPSPITRPSGSGLPTSESLERVASGSLRSQSSHTALLAQARQGFPEYERSLHDSSSSAGHGAAGPGLMAVDPAPVSLDLMSVAAATGRMTSVHNQAFDTLSPEDGQVVLEQLKQRSSFRIRISRAFGGNGNSKDGVNGLGHNEDNGRDGRSASPHVVGVGKSHREHHHHLGGDSHHAHAHGPHEAAFEPPWMLMTPMYVKEAVIAAERSMYTGFASLGLAVQPNKKSKRQPPPPSPIITPAMRRNSVLDSVPNEAMCMVLPLWDLTLDLEEDKRRRRQMVDDLDIDLADLEEEDEDEQEEDTVDEMLVDEAADVEALERKRLARELAKRRKMMPPPRVERKYLLAYYVPFDAKRQSMAATTSIPPPPPPPVPPLLNEQRTSKKRPRQGTNAAASRPSLQRRNSGSAATKPLPVKSFRVIARILTPAELRDSGLNPPRNIVDPKRMQQQSTSYLHSSLNYHRMDRRLSSSSIFGDVVPSAFNAVIAVCNDRKRGVEFVPEGLDSLGLCGGETLVGPNGAVEKLPPLFPPAHMVPVKERLTPPLNPVGRQIVEMIWAGCLALTELGI